VADGFQAVEVAKEEPFDLILMDIQMPIIALTAYARPEEIESFHVQGFNRAVTKPTNEGQLRLAIAGIS